MDGLIVLAVVLLLYFALQLFILPKLGVPT